MADKPESKYTRKLCNSLRQHGVKVVPLVGGKRTMAGLPDRFFAHPSIQGGVWVEFKAHDGKLSAIQRQQIGELIRCKVCAVVGTFSEDGSRVTLAYGNVASGNVTECAATGKSFLQGLQKLHALHVGGYHIAGSTVVKGPMPH